MEKISDQEFGEFLTNRPLYYKIKAVENLTSYNSFAYMDHISFKDKPFKFNCPHEKEVQTFRTEFTEEHHIIFSQWIRNNPDELPHAFNKETRKLDFKIHLHGVCQSCKQKIDFLIHATSDKKWDERKDGINIYLQKIGQFPPYEIQLSKSLRKYLSIEDQENYKKALVCLSISYGIGAYSYLRRVIENEIKRIIKDISELEFDGVTYVREAYQNFQSDFQMSKLIEVINKHLPSSLMELGDNPIRLLYEQLSGGIHQFTDEECVEKSNSIDILLNYVIRKLGEEKYQWTSVKDAMKNLRKNNG